MLRAAPQLLSETLIKDREPMFASSRWIRPLVLLVAVFALAACGGGGGSSDQTTTFTVQGKVSNGPLVGSTVQVLEANGGSALGSATTGADGSYRVEVSGAGPYRLRATGGKMNGVDYTGVLEAACAGGSNCFVTPYTTVILRLVDDHGFNAGDAASHLATSLVFDGDPFAGGVPAETFDLDAARQALAGGDGLATWVASMVAWATSEDAEPPPGVGGSGSEAPPAPEGPPGPPGEPDPAPPPEPDPEPDPEPVPDPDPAPVVPGTYTVSAIAGGGGSISPSSQTVAQGATATFTASPATGYSINQVTGCGGTLVGSAYTTGAITAACTVEASFLLNSHTVSTTVAPIYVTMVGGLSRTMGPGGTISPASQSVVHGERAIFTLSSPPEHPISSVSGCGGTLSGDIYTTGPIINSCLINVQFAFDPAFPVNNGKLTTKILDHSHSSIGAMNILPDGKILAAGTTVDRGIRVDVALAQYDQDGTLDSGFGNDGIVTTNISRIIASNDSVGGMHIQPDGKIVIVGATNQYMDSRVNLFIARYLPDGRLDTSFSDTGISLTDRGVNLPPTGGAVFLDDGKILVAGGDYWSGYFLARYHNDGSLDESFAVDGFVYSGAIELVSRVRLNNDGKILVSGVSSFSGHHSASYIVLTQHHEDGSFDLNFGASGRVETVVSWDLHSASWTTDMLVQPDGKILLGGWARIGDATGRLLIVRYNADGTLDLGFGDNGFVISSLPINDSRTVLALQEDGKILAASSSRFPRDGDHPWPGVYAPTINDFVILRYDENGELDPGFGEDGMATVDFRKVTDRPARILVQPDGKILVGGSSETHVVSSVYDRYTSFAVTRLNADGSLDTSFNPR